MRAPHAAIRRFAAPLIGILFQLGSPPSGVAENAMPKISIPRRGDAQLDLTERLLREGRHEDAAAVVARTMSNAHNAGPPRVFRARTYALRALAAAGQGQAEDAGLDWTIALLFDSKIRDWDLSQFGEAGRALAVAFAASLEVSLRALPPSTPGLTAPVLLKDSMPRLPHDQLPCRWRSTTNFDGWLDENGRLRGIRRAHSDCDDSLIVSAIEAVRRRQYSAAKDATGRPVAVQITNTLNTLRHEDPFSPRRDPRQPP